MKRLTDSEIDAFVSIIDRAKQIELKKGNWWKTYDVEVSSRRNSSWKEIGILPLPSAYTLKTLGASIKTVGSKTYIYSGDDRYLIDDEIKALFD